MTYTFPAEAKIRPDVAARLAPYVTQEEFGKLEPVISNPKERGQTKVDKVLNRIGWYGSPLWMCLPPSGLALAGASTHGELPASDTAVGCALFAVSIIGWVLFGRGNVKEERVNNFVANESQRRLIKWLKNCHNIEADEVFTWRSNPKASTTDFVRALQQGERVHVGQKRDGPSFYMTASLEAGKWVYNLVNGQGKPLSLTAQRSTQKIQAPKPSSAIEQSDSSFAGLDKDGRQSLAVATELLTKLPGELSIEQAHLVNRSRETLTEVMALANRLSTFSAPKENVIGDLNRALEGVVADLRRVATAEEVKVELAARVLADYVSATQPRSNQLDLHR